jgi:mRNA-degrading endonuclease RelE of RelBE toxin-antitoxin system
MKYEAKPTPLFRRQFKKFHRNEQEIIARIVENIRENPAIGEALKGEVLTGCRSVEVGRIPGNLRLIFRVISPESLIHLIAVGPHRTIYDDATRYVKETGLRHP